ncbi:MAG: YggT family protein [Deltaproteobacteria bacterium]|nr:YggT family protein [Candidatus Anaeroferrophillacea bacterium]
MIYLANLVFAVAQLLKIALNIYMWVIIARAVLSWVNPDPYNPIVNFLYRVTEPVLFRVRRWLPVGGMGIDFSPMIVLLLIFFLDMFVVRSLFDLAASLR